ncbi:hypothetical protein BOX15_Mlig021101g2 [Macrostomum lignano]|uniref:Medium-chain acyl-CoA ligase ACSF2, mitochondrial n=1 Tax=Macrostomum lignano TaxID=282301 RepID=A0A267DUM7_9PLAT|nr:hypothetical protein BOX15_Mlig021101g2 [Macrostomum lignano]
MASTISTRLLASVTVAARTLRRLSLGSRLHCQQLPSPPPERLSYACGPTDIPLMGGTIGQLLDVAVAKNPDREAFVFRFGGGRDGSEPQRRTMAEFRAEVDQLARGFLSLGLNPGDRLGIWGPNSREWVTTQFAAAKAGLVLVNINPAYRPHELEYCVNRVGIRALVSAPNFKTSDYYAMLCELCPELPKSRVGGLSSSVMPSLSHVVMMGQEERPGAFLYDEVCRAGGADPNTEKQLHKLAERLQMDDVINIQFTSGTTGSPKGAALTHHNILNNAYFVGMRCEFHKHVARICVQVPFYHCFGMGLGNLQIVLHGATCIYPSPSFEPAVTLSTVEAEKCTALYGTPTMFIDILSQPDVSKRNLRSLQTGIIAGSPCPVEVMRRIVSELHMDRVTIAYGTTENSPVTFQGMPDDSLEKRTASVGRPSAHMEVKIADPEGRALPIGQRGEICIRGYAVMRGYFNDTEKTSEVIGEDRWYRTGDIGFLDADGYGHIRGRIRDMVIRGGENIYPVEIENFLHGHPAIADAQIVGVPDERMGEELCVVVRLRPGMSLTEAELKAYCKDEIAHFKIPRYVLFRDEYPMTVTGKVQKFKLREDVIKELGLEKAAAIEIA